MKSDAIPYFLVWFRLCLAPCFGLGYVLGVDQRLYVVLLLAGIASDIFDGVLARRWKCVTPELRRLDGNVDTIFYGCAGMVAVLLHTAWLQPWLIGFLAMFVMLIAQNVVNGVRYRRQPSYHMWSGKLWSIAIVVALIGLFVGSPSTWAIDILIGLGIYNSIEGIIASIILPRPFTDIPTVFHAFQLARAK